MKTYLIFFAIVLIGGMGIMFKQQEKKHLLERLKDEAMQSEDKAPEKLHLTDAEWKEQLTADGYEVLRKHGTERAFTGKYDKFYDKGIYHCAGCDLSLFNSEDKFDSGTGWPSFTQPIRAKAVSYKSDASLVSSRVEVHCNRCDGHLGHVFEDGPVPTGLRYCLNSVSLNFKPD